MKKLLFALVAGFALMACEKEEAKENVYTENVVFNNYSQLSNGSWVGTKDLPSITQDVVNDGFVLMYAEFNGFYSQLPLTVYPSPDYSVTFETDWSLNTARVIINYSDGLEGGAPNPLACKIVTVQGVPYNASLDHSNYDEVKTYYQIED